MARALTQKQVEGRRKRERAVVAEMIASYCHGNHGTSNGELCAECQALIDYAPLRIARCPFMDTKTFCSQCAVHCYAAPEREKIRRVMRSAGLRMLFLHPVITIHHGIDTLRARLM